MMRAAITVVLLCAGCSGRDATKTPDDSKSTMPNSALQLQITETVAEVAGTDLAINPVDTQIWAYLRGGITVHSGPTSLGSVFSSIKHGLSYAPDGARVTVGLTQVDGKTGELAGSHGGTSSFLTGLSRPARVEALDAYVEELSAACSDPEVTVVMARWTRPRNRSVTRTEAPPLRLIVFGSPGRDHLADLTAALPPELDVFALACSKRWVVALTPFPVVWDRGAAYARVAGDAKLPAGAALAIRPDDTAFAIAGTTVEPTGTVTLLDPATLAVLGRLDAKVGAVWSLAFSPDGKRLAVGGTDALAVLDVDGATLTPAATLEIGAGPVTALAFEPDGAALRLLGGPGMVRVALR